MKAIKKIVLAYSGGLDTSVMIKWLRDNYKAEVIAMAADVGQEEELTGLREKALSSGASKFYLEDLRDEFVASYIFPALAAGAIYEGKYLLGTALARPLIAKRLVEIAKIEKAQAIAHGATGKGNDQVRFELTVKALAPDLKIIAPWREWELKSREDEIKYARKHKIDISVTKDKPYSMDRNLWHLSYEGGILEDPANAPDEEMFLLTTSPEKAPDKPTEVEINFKEGIPCEVDGERLSQVELIRKLNKMAGVNGIGRVDLVENRLVGMKSRGVYETPAGTLLYLAHRELEHLCLDRETLHYKELISHKYAELIYYGQWFLPLREAFDAFVKVTQERVTGKVKIKLYKGNAVIISRQSPYSLYQEDLATFEEDEIYNQKDAEGFINLFGLPLKVLAQRQESSLPTN